MFNKKELETLKEENKKLKEENDKLKERYGLSKSKELKETIKQLNEKIEQLNEEIKSLEEIQLLPSDIENARYNKLTINKWKSGSLSIPVIDITSNNKKEY